MRYEQIKNGSASALIWCRLDDTYLWLLRSEFCNEPLKWCLPGGHVESHEDHITALHRELGEEIGHDLENRPTTLLSSRTTQEPVFVAKTYAICVNKRFEPDLNWEHVDHKWATLEEAPVPRTWWCDMLMSNDKAAKRLLMWQKKIRETATD